MNNILLTLAQEATPSTCCGLSLSRIYPFVVLLIAMTFLAWVISRSMKTVREARKDQEEAIRLQKEYIARTEALLERIATAVEKLENKP